MCGKIFLKDFENNFVKISGLTNSQKNLKTF